MGDAISELTNQQRLCGRREVLLEPQLIPASPGLYAWYFQEAPPGVPLEGCVTRDGKTLLYLGISPCRPESRQHLRKRIISHFRGNAGSSTLRRTLGLLLADTSGFLLRRVGSGKRITLTHAGEQHLDEWMEANAFVCWVPRPTPWTAEAALVRAIPCPLNISANDHHPFASRLKVLRAQALREAKEAPIADERGWSRKHPMDLRK